MTQTLYAEDQSGNRHKVIQRLEPPHEAGHDAAGQGSGRVVYALDDGTPVRRVDSDTFQIIGTGAYISTVRD